MKAKDALLLFALGMVAAALGFALGHVLLAEGLIHLIAGAGSGESERNIVNDIALQASCAGPFLLLLGSLLASLAILMGRLVKVSLRIRGLALAALAFVAGFGAYLPLEFLLMAASAF